MQINTFLAMHGLSATRQAPQTHRPHGSHVAAQGAFPNHQSLLTAAFQAW
jgi:hypothetical protein